MARTSLSDIRSLPDPLLSYNWDLILPRIPGYSDSKPFTFKCQTAAVPGMMLEQVPVALHGVELRYAGRKNYSHSMSVTILETRDMSSRAMFLAWNETARSWLNNTGSYKDVYGVNAELVLYDDIPTQIRKITLVGAWPEDVGEGSLDGSQSAAVTYTVQFSFDFSIDE
jgi:hypothetical protein